MVGTNASIVYVAPMPRARPDLKQKCDVTFGKCIHLFFSIRQQQYIALRPHIIFCNYFNTYILIAFQASSIISISVTSVTLKFNYNCHCVYTPRNFIAWPGWADAQPGQLQQRTQRMLSAIVEKQMYPLTGNYLRK